MFKKILSVLLVAIFAMGTVAVTASAEETTAPAEDVYTPVEHKIADIVAAIEEGEDYYINPTDTIVLYETEEEETTEAVDTQEDGEETTTPAYSDVLIVEYTTNFNDGSESSSGKGFTKFADYDTSGYSVLEVNGNPDYGYKGSTRTTRNTMDFKSELGYGFKTWKVKTVYSGKEFNRVTLVAVWDIPELTGWEGFLSIFREYMKIYIDAITAYFSDLFARIGAFFV